MTTFTWTRTSGAADWSTATDWTPAGGPPDSATDTALIDAAGDYVVNLRTGDSFAPNQVTLDDAAATRVTRTGGLLDLSGIDPTLTLNAGTLHVGSASPSSGAGATLTIAAGGTITDRATLVVAGGAGSSDSPSVQPGGTFAIAAGARLTNDDWLEGGGGAFGSDGAGGAFGSDGAGGAEGA